MPVREWSRGQAWLMPPSVEDLIAADHPVRFVAAFVEALGEAGWAEVGIDPRGAAEGAPSYAPEVLLSVWGYGFLNGVRTSRKLETACREQVPYLWLSGGQRPDHNTLWRFYQAHREGMRGLLKRTVRTAVRAGLVDLAVLGVDGTKLSGNAARGRSYDAAGLQKLLERTEKAITELEARNSAEAEAAPPRLPQELCERRALRERVVQALATVRADERRNLTDADAVLVKTRQGVVAGYNGQAAVAPLVGQAGLLITAAEVVAEPTDHGQLLPMLQASEEAVGAPPGVLLSDGGYLSGTTLRECEARGQRVAMPEAGGGTLDSPYHREAFRYEAATDSYLCPTGQRLSRRPDKARPGRTPARLYRVVAPAACRACPAFGSCTRDTRRGRSLEVAPPEEERALRSHRAWMATEEAQALYARRKTLPEPVFGILKEQQNARRLLLRSLAGVRAEWSLLATAFNLRTLWRQWRARPAATRSSLLAPLAA